MNARVGYSIIIRPLLSGLPPSNSSFSRPIGFLSDMSSPVPMAPCLPLRNTSARAVEGKRPFSSRRLACLTWTWRLPTGTRSVRLDGVAGPGSGLDTGFLGGMQWLSQRAER